MTENRRLALLDDWDKLTRTARRPPIPARADLIPARVSSRVSPQAGAVLFVALLVLAVVALQELDPLGTNGPGGATWGPLAVFRSDAGMQARNEGTLVITADCTFLERKGERTVLGWPTPETSWDPASAQISFKRPDGRDVTVRNGDSIVLGGGGSSRVEDGLTGEEWADRVEWIARPGEACLVDERFLISDVMKQGPGPT